MIIEEDNVKARKEHYCTACDHILHAYGIEGYELNDGLKDFLTDDQIKDFHEHVKTHKSKIKPGQVYRKYTCVEAGVFYKNKELLICFEIVKKYDLWES